jgi:hypothetical protein
MDSLHPGVHGENEMHPVIWHIVSFASMTTQSMQPNLFGHGKAKYVMTDSYDHTGKKVPLFSLPLTKDDFDGLNQQKHNIIIGGTNHEDSHYRSNDLPFVPFNLGHNGHTKRSNRINSPASHTRCR